MFSLPLTANLMHFVILCVSAGCFQNHASNILKSNNIEPYIWMSGNMKKLAKETVSEKKSLSVLGIACLPELINGMRDCRKNGLHVVGLPLNANRCIRWFGKFFPNSIDLTELRRLVEIKRSDIRKSTDLKE